MANVMRLASAFRSYRVILFENDSTDGTKRELRRWGHARNVTILTGRYMSILRREKVLEFGRNTILSHIRSNGLDREFDLWINMDLDDVSSLKPVRWDALDSTLRPGKGSNRETWDVVCSNTWPAWYYDRFALRTRSGPYHSEGCTPGDCHENRPVDLKAWFGPSFTGHGIARNHSSWIPVQSCFGGMAIYKTRVLRMAEYKENDANPGVCWYDGTSDCEHVTFHECLRKSRAKVFINPSFVPFDIETHLIPHSPSWGKLSEEERKKNQLELRRAEWGGKYNA
eukprot:CAMPEP_0167779442 /NCGR_PEP_ID=MMETSP0111_2-20121227/4805_1 /TAXON_ID=91324 /ORGANISM="Lotharella globosa, Strain CCCM811" /LENGTH=282 /DNA_ID=CAMNT_0007669845 /DNA_START=307 /DNA_END=1155 /DNA_ORIENTATION=-